MRKKIIAVFFSLVLLSSFLFADSIITLDDALALAKERNTDMEVARRTLSISLRDSSLLSSYIPDFSLEGSIGLEGSAISKSFSTGMDLSIGLSIDLGSNFISDAAKKSAERTLAYITYALSEESIIESVTKSYLALSRSKKEIESATLSLERAEENLSRLEESYSSGLTSELELKEAEVSLLSAEYDLKVLIDAYDIAKISFKILTGLDEDFEIEDLEYEGKLNLPSSSELFNIHGRESNTIKSLEAEVSVSEAELVENQVNYLYPSLKLSGGYDLDGARWWGSYSDASWSDFGYVSLSLSIPLSSYIPGSEGSNKVKNSEDNIAIKKINLSRGKSDLESEINQASLEIYQSYENISLLTRKRDVYALSYALALEGYTSGTLSSSELLEKSDDLSKASLELSSAKSSYLEAIYNLSFKLSLSFDELIELYGENN